MSKLICSGFTCALVAIGCQSAESGGPEGNASYRHSLGAVPAPVHATAHVPVDAPAIAQTLGARWSMIERTPRPAVPGGTWNPPAFADAGHEAWATSPSLSVDAGGNALLVWQAYDSQNSTYDLWSNRSTAGVWGTPERIVAGSYVYSHMTRGDDSGRAITTWRTSDGGRSQLRVAHFDPATGWTPPLVLAETTDQDPYGYHDAPFLRVHRTGDALLVWRYQTWNPATGSYYTELNVRSYEPGHGWSPVDTMPVTEIASYYEPLYDLAVDDMGRAVLVWAEQDSTDVRIWSRRGTIGALGAPELVATQPRSAVMQQLFATIDDAGDVAALWAYLNIECEGSNVAESRAPVGGAWQMPQIIERGLGSGGWTLQRIALTTSGAGETFLMWREAWTDASAIMAKHYRNGQWSAAEVIADGLHAPTESCAGPGAIGLQIAMTEDGRALAVWEEPLEAGSFQLTIWANDFTPTGWGVAEQLSGASVYPERPRVGIDAAGDGYAAWTETDASWTTMRVASRRFTR